MHLLPSHQLRILLLLVRVRDRGNVVVRGRHTSRHGFPHEILTSLGAGGGWGGFEMEGEADGEFTERAS